MVKYEKLNEMCEWEREKARYLIKLAEDIGYDTEYAYIGVKTDSDYTYIWSEFERFILFMPINCDLRKSDVGAIWINDYNDNEEEFYLTEDTTLEDLNKWVNELEEE